MLGNDDDLLNAALAKLEQSYCFNFGIFSSVGGNGIYFGCGGMVGAVVSEIVKMFLIKCSDRRNLYN